MRGVSFERIQQSQQTVGPINININKEIQDYLIYNVTNLSCMIYSVAHVLDDVIYY